MTSLQKLFGIGVLALFVSCSTGPKVEEVDPFKTSDSIKVKPGYYLKSEGEEALSAAVRTCLFTGDKAQGVVSVSTKLMTQMFPKEKDNVRGIDSIPNIYVVVSPERDTDLAKDLVKLPSWIEGTGTFPLVIAKRFEFELSYWGYKGASPSKLRLHDRETLGVTELTFSKPLPAFKTVVVNTPSLGKKIPPKYSAISLSVARSGKTPIALLNRFGKPTAFSIDPREYVKCLQTQIESATPYWVKE